MYALSAPPDVSGPAGRITYDVMLAAMKGKVLASVDFSVVYSREGASQDQDGRTPPTRNQTGTGQPSPSQPDAGGPQSGPGAEGSQAGNGGPRLLPGGAREKLNLTAEQEKQVAELEAEVKSKLAKILTPDQLEKLKQMRPPQGQRGPGDQGGPGQGAP